jgi:hypothetical protein
MLVFVIAAAVAAATPPADPPTAVAPAEVTSKKAKADDDPDKIVCKSQPIPGSKMTGRVCAPRRQWDNNEQAAKDLVRGMQQRSGIGDPPPFRGP